MQLYHIKLRRITIYTDCFQERSTAPCMHRFNQAQMELYPQISTSFSQGHELDTANSCANIAVENHHVTLYLCRPRDSTSERNMRGFPPELVLQQERTRPRGEVVFRSCSRVPSKPSHMFLPKGQIVAQQENCASQLS